MKRMDIPVGVSNRHLHLSAKDLAVLFGETATLTVKKNLKQVGQFASEETVTLVGPKGSLDRVRVLGPTRDQTQVEISVTDSFKLGLKAPLRDSGQLAGSAGVDVIGPTGRVALAEGLITAQRHIHIEPELAEQHGLADRSRVTVVADTERGGHFTNVLVRVHPTYRLELHIDTDEANALALTNNSVVSACWE